MSRNYLTMSKKLLLFFASLCLCTIAFAQQVSGIVMDISTREPLIGVSIQMVDNPEYGAVTDLDGRFELTLPSNSAKFQFSYIGYETEERLLTKGVKNVNVLMRTHNELLDEVVVSAGRYEQRLTDVTVSMEVLKPEAIKSQIPTDLSATLQTLPGVEIVDKQPSIRGGGGWTYSVGSRCQVLMDEMTVLNPKTGEVNWNNIPLENVAQVEVIKGASSVLYGSSALNGVINVRTQRPGLKPETKVSMYTGIYDNYKNYYHTGSHLPVYLGVEASHSRRVEDFDVSASASIFSDQGYRQQSFNKRMRMGGNMTYHAPMSEGKYLNAGFNANYIGSQYGDFFLWRSPLKPLQASPLSNMGRKEHNFNIDPFLNYNNTATGISHKLRTRFFVTSDNINRPTATKSLGEIVKNMGGKLDLETAQNYFSMLQEGDISFLDPLVIGYYDIADAFEEGSEVTPAELNNKIIDLIHTGIDFANGLVPGITVDDATDLLGYGLDLLADKSATRPEMTYNFYLDYQFAKQWENGVRLTAGANWNHVTNTANITGRHQTDNAALYLQYDHRIANRLSLSAGVRFEYYRMDDDLKEANIKIGDWTCPVRPVLRAGLNWEIYKAGFLRASYGQGYRNPSITEKFARKDIGGVGVYPNNNVKPESGYNVELGYKQLYKLGPLSGFLDISGFFMEYKDMIEYQFGLFDNSDFTMINSLGDAYNMVTKMLNREPGAGVGIGAQFVNVSHARIYGLEVSTSGKFDFKRDMSLTYTIGYTFTQPEDMDNDERIAKEATYTDPLQMKNKSNDSKYLKYRNKHSFKASLDYNVKWFTIGTNLSYRSKMLAVDYLMLDEREKPEKDIMDYVRTFIFGYEDGQTLATYWAEHNKGVFTMDLRMGIRFKKHTDLQFIVNNVLNTEYSFRPMALAAPRSYVCRLNLHF